MYLHCVHAAKEIEMVIYPERLTILLCRWMINEEIPPYQLKPLMFLITFHQTILMDHYLSTTEKGERRLSLQNLLVSPHAFDLSILMRVMPGIETYEYI